MIALALLAGVLAQEADCSDGQAAWLAELESSGSRRAYQCLSLDPAAHGVLIARATTGTNPERVTRALAIWRLSRLEEAITAPEARTYNPADRRLLLDGIRAHRGRRTPAPVHSAVMEQLSWYAPDDRYTDARLTALDRQNLAILESPPEPEPAPEPAPEPEPEQNSRCGCGAISPANGALGLWLALGLSWRRRAGRGASGSPQRAARLPGG